jgi:hypothetical protein
MTDASGTRAADLYVVKFPGYYLGGCAVVAAHSEGAAKRKVIRRLPTSLEPSPEQMSVRLLAADPVDLLWDGDY